MLHSIRNKLAKRIKYRPGLRFYMSAICITTICASGSLVAYHSLRTLYDGSLRDAWAILFLDLEKQANRAAKNVQAAADTAISQGPVIEFQLSNKGSIKSTNGTWANYSNLDQIGLDEQQINPSSGVKYAFTSINGDHYVARLGSSTIGPTVQLFKTNFRDFITLIQIASKKTIVYVSNRSGRLLATNTSAVSPANLLSRPLVSAFVKAPFSQGQSEFGIGKESFYGFHQELPGTNLILFAEKSKMRAMENVYLAVQSVSKVTAWIFMISLILLQIPLTLMTRPIKRLARVANEIARGNFAIKSSASGFGELKILTTAFDTMTESLRQRDQVISNLNDQRLQQIQIENDLKLARTIQDQFLFHPSTEWDCGIDLATIYTPSKQVAGDWLGVHYFKESAETVMAIVDITGHGVSSAMMTPVISVLFYEYTRAGGMDSPVEFLKRCNDALYSYGKGRSTASGLIMNFNKKSKTLTWFNAGHPKPILLDQTGKRITENKTAEGTSILGLSQDFTPEENHVLMSHGAKLLIYSDGLTLESVHDSSSKRINRRDLVNILTKSPTGKAVSHIEAIHSMWRERVINISDTDDMCAIAGVIV